ncbi:MAG: hypothetical protein K2P59_03590, partial [Acetatifactor sp.]|nr:hypothetical protein [Acetatifactor sp.]
YQCDALPTEPQQHLMTAHLMSNAITMNYFTKYSSACQQKFIFFNCIFSTAAFGRFSGVFTFRFSDSS